MITLVDGFPPTSSGVTVDNSDYYHPTQGLGYLPDTHDQRDYSFGHLLAAPTPSYATGKSSMLDLRGPILRQGSVGACVAFAGARAIYMSLRAQGVANPPIPSPQFGYYNARMFAQSSMPPAQRVPVVDQGCYPRLYMMATQKLGFASMDDCPFDPDTKDQEPAPQCYVDAYPQRDFTYYRISEQGSDKVEAVAEALSRGYPVIFGTQIDRAFTRHKGTGLVWNIDANSLVGGHMMTVLAVDEDYLLIDNWWGTGWGVAGEGYYYMDQSLFAKCAGDVYAIVAAPSYA